MIFFPFISDEPRAKTIQSALKIDWKVNATVSKISPCTLKIIDTCIHNQLSEYPIKTVISFARFQRVPKCNHAAIASTLKFKPTFYLETLYITLWIDVV